MTDRKQIEPCYHRLATIVRHYMLLRGHTPSSLAHECGWPVSSLQATLHTTARTHLHDIHTLADVLGVKPTDLLQGVI